MPEQVVRANQVIPINQALPDDLFMQGLREDSNLEMDWLWLASSMTDDGQRRYCFRRALAINPESCLAQRGLDHLLHPSRKPLKRVLSGLRARAGKRLRRQGILSAV